MTTIIQPISEVARPVRRRLYQVPVVVLKPVADRSNSGYFTEFDVVPVLGAAHGDPEGGTQWLHYHVDWRFMPPAMRRALCDYRGPGYEKAVVLWASDVLRLETQALAYRNPASSWPNWDGGFRARIEAATLGKQLLPGLLCPHRGADLSHCPADENGVVECPMHGLRWNIHTGQLVPTTPARA